jgi:hypothetical protein
LFGGREWVRGGIGEGGCLNCILDDVDLDGGWFVEPGLELRLAPQEGMAIYYRIFEPASDLAGRLTLRYIYSSP